MAACPRETGVSGMSIETALTRRGFIGATMAGAGLAAAGLAAAASERRAAPAGRRTAELRWVSDAWRADPEVSSLVASIQFGDRVARRAAIERAALVGSAAVMPLCEVAGGPDPEAARAASDALEHIVTHCSRPGADPERRACSIQLARLRSGRYAPAVRARAARLLAERIA